MRRLSLLWILLLVPFSKGLAQERFYFEDHQHSITLSTGIPPILPMMYPRGSANNGYTMDGWNTGTGYKTHFSYTFTLAYNYQFTKRWEMALVATTCGYIYSQYQHPEKGVNDYGVMTYDWDDSKRQYQGTYLDFRGIIPAAMVRFYWLARESVQMYSAVGAGLMFSSPVILYPTLTPVGIRFGKKHWFGLAELTVGSTATILLAGAGYRF